MYDVKDKVFLITGGAAGIGAAVVKALLEEGAKHVAIVDINQNAGVTLENELKKAYDADRVQFIKCDITNDEQLRAAFKNVTDDYEYIDTVINSAAIFDESRDMFKKEISINVTALTVSTMMAFDLMNKENGGKGGTIINFSSEFALRSVHFAPIYAGGKSHVLHFSNCLGVNEMYTRTGVRVIVVMFGGTSTAMLSEEAMGSFDEQCKLGFLGAIKAGIVPLQKVESAAIAVIEAYKRGDSGSTWLSGNDKPVFELTDTLRQIFDIFNDTIIKAYTAE